MILTKLFQSFLFCLIFTSSVSASELNDLFRRDIPPPEEAFHLFVVDENENGVTLEWTIAPNTYLYQKSLEFSAKGAELGSYTFPPGDLIQDPFFGDVTVYHQQLTMYLPFEVILRENVILTVTYQGCHEAGICYPPQTKKFMLYPTRNDPSYFAFNFSDIPSTFLLFFVLGFLLALTPCVLPMIPILSALIIGEQQQMHRLKALYLAITYVVFMALAYAGLGAAVSHFGTHLQAQMQHPIVIILTASILMLMAICMVNDKIMNAFTRFNAPLIHLSNRMQGGKFISVAIMGAISALIVSPCVTPPLIAALTYITSTGKVALGSTALFALGIGMGIPLIAVTWLGTAVLPKRGRWMIAIKYIFCILLMGMAIYLFSRLLPQHSVLPFTNIQSIEALDRSLNTTKEKEQPAMVYFYADWCISCASIERQVFTDPTVQTLLTDVTLIKADLTHVNDETRALMNQYQIFGPPAFLFFDQGGTLETQFSINGDISRDDFIKNLESWQTTK